MGTEPIFHWEFRDPWEQRKYRMWRKAATKPEAIEESKQPAAVPNTAPRLARRLSSDIVHRRRPAIVVAAAARPALAGQDHHPFRRQCPLRKSLLYPSGPPPC